MKTFSAVNTNKLELSKEQLRGINLAMFRICALVSYLDKDSELYLKEMEYLFDLMYSLNLMSRHPEFNNIDMVSVDSHGNVII